MAMSRCLVLARGSSRITLNECAVQFRKFSAYQQGASHKLQASQSVVSPELPLYNEQAARQWLAQHTGGQVHLEKDEDSGIACITVENNGRKNALTGQMMIELAEAVNSLENWKNGKAVILRGKDSQFCSGGDLNFMSKIADPTSGSKMSIFMQTVTSKIKRMPLLTAALVEGHALGGGAELTVACDFRIFSESAKIGFVQCRLGISTGWGGGTHLVKLLGPRIALQLLTSGRVLGAQEAMKMGLADTVLSSSSSGSDDALRKCKEWIQQNYLLGYPAAIQAAKRVVFNVEDCDYAEAMNRERDMFTQLWGGRSHKHALEKVVGANDLSQPFSK